MVVAQAQLDGGLANSRVACGVEYRLRDHGIGRRRDSGVQFVQEAGLAGQLSALGDPHCETALGVAGGQFGQRGFEPPFLEDGREQAAGQEPHVLHTLGHLVLQRGEHRVRRRGIGG